MFIIVPKFTIMDKLVSPRTIDRVLIYIRTLERLIKAGQDLVSSRDLAEITGVSDVQIRKDISNFGKVGTPRIGYKTKDLKSTLEVFLLQQDTVCAALFGVGHLGSAILRYPGFQKDKIRIVAAFDKSKAKVGREINGIRVHALEDAPKIIRKNEAQIGIMAVPGPSAQDVADIMVAAGLKGIVNFAPASLNVPRQEAVRDIDLTIEFLSLYCGMNRTPKKVINFSQS